MFMSLLVETIFGLILKTINLDVSKFVKNKEVSSQNKFNSLHNFECFFCCSEIFFKITFFKKLLQESTGVP